MKLWLRCTSCGQTAHEDNWGSERICPYCHVRGNYTSSWFPPKSGKIVIQKPEEKAPAKFEDFERAAAAIHNPGEPLWKCSYCKHLSPASRWIQQKYKCPNCGYRSIEYQLKPEIAPAPPQPAMPAATVTQPTATVASQSKKAPEESHQAPEKSEVKEEKKSLPVIVKIGIVLVIAVVVFMIANSKLPQTAPSAMSSTLVATEAPADVNIQVTPIDIKSVDYIQTEQIIIIILLVAILVTGWLDRKMSNQPWDAYLAIVCAILVLFGASKAVHFVASGFQAWGISEIAAYRFTSMVISIVSLVTVILVSLYGTLDLTPIGMFFGILGLGGGVLLGHVGSLQEMLHIPAGPLLSLGQVFQFLRLKDIASVEFSLLIYACLLLSILAELREILKPYENKNASFGGLALSILNIVIYILLRLFGKNISGSIGTVVSSPYGALLIFFVLNLLAAALLRERVDNMFGNTTTDYKMGQARVMSPWDIMLFQSVLGGMLTILFHAI